MTVGDLCVGEPTALPIPGLIKKLSPPVTATQSHRTSKRKGREGSFQRKLPPTRTWLVNGF